MQNIYLYSFSTIPQVLAATSAIIAAFIHFRINKIHDTLIGYGQAVYNRVVDGEYGYSLEPKFKKRLSDGISRKKIDEIKEILRLLSEQEKKEGFTKTTRKTGLQHLYEDRFCVTETIMQKLRKWTYIVIASSFFVILFSVVLISQIECFENNPNVGKVLLWIDIVLFAISLVLSFILVYFGLKDNDK